VCFTFFHKVPQMGSSLEMLGILERVCQILYFQEDHGVRFVKHMGMIPIIAPYCRSIKQYERVHFVIFASPLDMKKRIVEIWR
jgi:hypothetical protein